MSHHKLLTTTRRRKKEEEEEEEKLWRGQTKERPAGIKNILQEEGGIIE